MAIQNDIVQETHGDRLVSVRFCLGRITLRSFGPLGPLGLEGAQHRQTLRPSRRRDPQQSPASFRIAVKDLEDPAVQCRWLAVSG